MAVPETSSTSRAASAAQGARRSVRILIVILGLMALGGLLLLAPLALLARNLRTNVNDLQSELGHAQTRIATANTPGPTTQALLEQLGRFKAVARELEAAHSAVIPGSYDYPAVMAAIAAYPREKVTLDGLAQFGDQITVEGRAASEADVALYAQALEASNLFERVVVRSIEPIPGPGPSPGLIIGPSPSPSLPEGNLTPTLGVVATPAPTGTVGLPPSAELDAFEPDDTEPKEISIGQPQTHTFNPLYDRDQATFSAQAGFAYRVYTANLAPGVDTYLVVMLGGMPYANDNRAAGDLASEVLVPGPASGTLPATVTVTNRGQYGPDKQYQLIVEQVLLTPTPSLSATATVVQPTSTPIPATTPSATITSPAPTATVPPIPSATPELPDAFEPDDMAPVPIAVGESQQHTFFPFNDVDKLTFLAKAGRRYRVFTSDLAVDVDTYLFLRVGPDTLINDDAQPGTKRSEVLFDVTLGYDVLVRIEVYNRGEYGAAKSYRIAVEEIAPPPLASDPYEPDDPTPRPIAIGETQTHTFHPADDVDKVIFLAKTGRSYRVSTLNLALGVDTLLNVFIADQVYTNDDRLPGDPGSLVTFTVQVPYDVTVVAEIRNRGLFGADKSYDIKVVEEPVLPGDKYEPDDETPKPIEIGEWQDHTFWPHDDLDKVTFLATAGHRYNISTNALAPHVDTILIVQAGGNVYVNNDRVPGDLASEVSFELPIGSSDLIVEVTIASQNRYYDPNAHYSLVVQASELGPTQTPTSSTVDNRGFRPRGPGLAAWGRGERLAQHIAAQQIEPSTSGPVRFALLLEPKTREMP
ncbi:MAG: PilN domain-containing protein [Chloroflexi bacterium]|nr:PilN domain-containing protein [Chloroflexota bacterium]